MALKLHPDKQKDHLSSRQREQIAQDFQNVQVAKAFLENPQAKQRYDAKRASRWAREQAEATRRQTQSQRQRTFQDELQRAEAQAMQNERTNKRARRSDGGASSSSNKKHKVDDLRAQGRNLREQYAQKKTQQQNEVQKHDIDDSYDGWHSGAGFAPRRRRPGRC